MKRRLQSKTREEREESLREKDTTVPHSQDGEEHKTEANAVELQKEVKQSEANNNNHQEENDVSLKIESKEEEKQEIQKHEENEKKIEDEEKKNEEKEGEKEVINDLEKTSQELLKSEDENQQKHEESEVKEEKKEEEEIKEEGLQNISIHSEESQQIPQLSTSHNDNDNKTETTDDKSVENSNNNNNNTILSSIEVGKNAEKTKSEEMSGDPTEEKAKIKPPVPARNKRSSIADMYSIRKEEDVKPELENCKKEILINLLSKDEEGLKQTIEKMKYYNGDINYLEGKDGLTLLHRCVIQGTSLEILKILIENGSNVNLRNLRGLSPLHLASQKGDLLTIELLLQYNANILQKDFENRTCLHWSAIGGHIECIDFFIRKNILINLKDNNGCTSLHYAVKHQHYNCIKYLLSNGADPTITDNQGHRPIDLLPGSHSNNSNNNNSNNNNNNNSSGNIMSMMISSPSTEKKTSESKKIAKLLKKSGGNKNSNIQISIPVGGGVSHKQTENTGITLDTIKRKSRNSMANASMRDLQLPSPISRRNKTTKRTDSQPNLSSLLTPLMNANSSSNIHSLNNTNSGSSGGSGSGSGGSSGSIRRSDGGSEVRTLTRNESQDDSEVGVKSTPSPSPSSSLSSSSTSSSGYNKYGFKEEGCSPAPLAKESIKKDNILTKKWLALTRNWDAKKYHSKIQKYCDMGIPEPLRGLVWKLLAKCEEDERNSNITYEDILKSDKLSQFNDVILRDLHRTMPNHALFEEKAQGKQMLCNVLTAYSIFRPEVGYCQGMGFITAMFLMYMPEEDAFWMLHRIANKYNFDGLWKENMDKISYCAFTFGSLLTQHVPEVKAKLDEMCIPTVAYTAQFFITGFLYSLPFHYVVRVWDSLLVRDFDFMYSVGLSMFSLTRERVPAMSMEQVMKYLKFKENSAELGFDETQLINKSIKLYGKIKSSTIRNLEEEAAKIRKADKERHDRSLRAKSPVPEGDSEVRASPKSVKISDPKNE